MAKHPVKVLEARMKRKVCVRRQAVLSRLKSGICQMTKWELNWVLILGLLLNTIKIPLEPYFRR